MKICPPGSIKSWSNLLHIVTREETFPSSNPARPPAWLIFFDEVYHIIDLEADLVRVLADVLIYRLALGALGARLRFRSRGRPLTDAPFPLLPWHALIRHVKEVLVSLVILVVGWDSGSLLGTQFRQGCTGWPALFVRGGICDIWLLLIVMASGIWGCSILVRSVGHVISPATTRLWSTLPGWLGGLW